MINKPTVFVLGAGASVDYGYPLGGSLIDLVISGLSETGFLRRALLVQGYPDADLEGFAKRLGGSRLTSIDAFLEKNVEQYQRIGKAAIAGTILLAEKGAATKLSKGGIEGDWLEYVWNTMRASTTVDTFPENRVTFVTFNYDRLVENYLVAVVANAFNLDRSGGEALCARTFEVHHLHGSIGGVPFGEFPSPLTGKLLGQVAKGIRIIHDDVLDDDPVFQSAYAALRNADRVCLLGFGYHPDNVRRLDLRGHMMTTAELSGTFFGMGKAEIQMAVGAVDRGFPVVGSPSEKCESFLRENVMLE